MDVTIVVWFSCGAASAVAAKKTIQKYGKDFNIRVVNNPVLEEDPDNIRFLKDVEKWLGVEIETAINPKWPSTSAVEVWDKKQRMIFRQLTHCTGFLKKQARQHWCKTNRADYHVLGYTYDEIDRYTRFIETEMDNVIPVLLDEMLTKDDCFDILEEAGIELPRVYAMGYKNANCIGCPKATSPAYWSLVKKTYPEVFKQRAEQSRRLKDRLVKYKGKYIYLDELPDYVFGEVPEGSDCGIFCEEKK